LSRDPNSTNRLRSYLSALPDNTRVLLQTVLLAVVAGILAVSFMLCINFLFAHTFLAFAGRSRAFFLIASFITIMGSSLVVGLLLFRYSPDAAGSGIPQLKAAYWKDLGYVPVKPILIKFIAGVLSIGGGASLGREGPTVFLGGGLASNVAGALGVPARRRRGAVVIGAAAGLAAAFNAPLAAVTFILEEFVGDINSRFIGRVVLSALLGAFVVFALVGHQPAFRLPTVDDITWVHYSLALLVALVASLAGVAFQLATLGLRGRIKHQKAVPAWLLPCCGGFAVWCIGAAVFCGSGHLGVFSLGYQDLSSALANDFAWRLAGVLVLAKLLATVLSYGLGACGGIFSPTLFIGGMCGCFIGGLANNFLPLTASDLIVLSAVGMSSCLGAVVRAPLTSVLIVFEMTHQFELVPGLMIGAIVSVLVAHATSDHNFYDAILLQDGHELIKIKPPLDLKSWQNLPVSAIVNPNPIVVRSFDRNEIVRILDNHPYNYFPVVLASGQPGLVTRGDLEAVATGGGVPNAIEPAVTCWPEQKLYEVSDKFIGSPHSVVVVVDRDRPVVVGLLTLHDLLRAQAVVVED